MRVADRMWGPLHFVFTSRSTFHSHAHAPPLVLGILGFERKLPKIVQWYYGWRSLIMADAARDRMIQSRV